MSSKWCDAMVGRRSPHARSSKSSAWPTRWPELDERFLHALADEVAAQAFAISAGTIAAGRPLLSRSETTELEQLRQLEQTVRESAGGATAPGGAAESTAPRPECRYQRLGALLARPSRRLR